ncbi:hypothetical protein GW17_00058510 [Ensete ventricosum]|nr:hypothetical protein GW17_00058510 [Ensete ventricosum]
MGLVHYQFTPGPICPGKREFLINISGPSFYAPAGFASEKMDGSSSNLKSVAVRCRRLCVVVARGPPALARGRSFSRAGRKIEATLAL